MTDLRPGHSPGPKNIQIGGLTRERARIDAGMAHNPVPQISPDAAAGIDSSASAGCRLSQTACTSPSRYPVTP